ncbi:tetratricopeptide repeat protein [Streptodolium elevatio]|uniref:Tetratricopeptide repeat protein n=1 Tax=Streptodolium elevatio TaxID=3157996 RepID=A0ABV3DJA1_9ACTN
MQLQQLWEASRIDDVLRTVDDVIAVCEREFAPRGAELGHLHTVKMNALGEAGRVAEARAHFGAVLPGFVAAGKHAGDAVPQLRTAMAGTLARYGDIAGAWEQYKLALAQRQKGRWSLRAFAAEVNVAGSLALAGGYAQAEAWLRALAGELLSVRDLAERMEADAALRTNLSFALIGLGRFAEAEENARLAAEAFASLEGPMGDSTRAARGNLASALVELGRAVEAERESRALIGWHEAYGRQDMPGVATLRTTLGRALAAQGRLDDAVAELRAAVDLGCATQGPSGWRTVQAVVALADLHTRMDDWAEARTLLETAVREGDATGRQDNPWLPIARARLAAVTEGLNRNM